MDGGHPRAARSGKGGGLREVVEHPDKQAANLWTSGLVRAVSEEALRLERPAVLAHTDTGNAFVAVAILGPCILGWPLRAESLFDGTVVLSWIDAGVPHLEDIFISDPFPAER